MLTLINPITYNNFLQQVKWVLDPVGYMQKAAQEHPDIFTASIIGFGNSLVFVNDPQAIQQILTNDRKQFSAPGELNSILKPILGNSSVMMLDSDRHRKRRQLIMPPFHGSRMQKPAIPSVRCAMLPNGDGPRRMPASRNRARSRYGAART